MCVFKQFFLTCRPFSNDLLHIACSVVTDWLKLNITALRHSHPDNSYQKPQPVSLTGDRYDVFISYSHKNSEAAAQIKRHLSVLYPDWKIFIDVSDLKTGVVWQTKLYNSIGTYLRNCVAALIAEQKLLHAFLSCFKI